MTGSEPTPALRRATIRTTHDDPEAIAAALDPDNTTEMTTEVAVDDESGSRQVVTTIERESTSGLQSTVDDYVVNCSVADRVAQTAKHTTDTTHNDNV